MTFTAVLLALFGWTTWFLQFFFVAGWTLVKAVLWAMSPVWLWAAIIGVISGCLTTPAKASWLSTWWEPDPQVTAAVQAAQEASARAAHLAAELSASRQANDALAQAASVANEAAKAQAHQHANIAEAITALSGERTQLAARLGDFTQVLRQDSAWAAALEAAGPVLIAVAVLALGCAAIWMTTRASDTDSQLVTVLVDEVTGTGIRNGLAFRQPYADALSARSNPGVPSLEHDEAFTPDTEPQEMLF